MATTRPSHIPVPSSPAPPTVVAPPSPSAFPSLSGTTDTADKPAIPAPPPTGIPSWASHAKKSLPPSKLPEGISLPASALPKPEQKERIQPSSNGKDSPYARPPAHQNGAGARKKPLPGSTRAGGVRSLSASSRASGAHASQSSADESATEKKDRPRTVPGMPASMLPPPVPKKKHHGRTPSTSGAGAGGMSVSQSMGDLSSASAADPALPGIGKKRRASLRKVLPPGSSRLSALAPSFDFVPRSATSPNLSAFASSSAGEESSDEALTDSAPAPEAEDKPTPSQDVASETKDEIAPETSVADASAPAVEKQLEPQDLVSGEEKAAISETVASAGAQGDEFRAKPFSAVDSEGAVESAPAEAGEQSATPNKAKGLPAADEGEVSQEKTALEPEEERTDRSFASFLSSAFAPSQEGSFAPLSLPSSSSSSPSSSPAATQPPQTQIPGAVSASPLADLQYASQHGWWSDDWMPAHVSALDIHHSEPPAVYRYASRGGLQESELAPAAVEALHAEEEIPLLKYPAWTPPAQEADSTLVKELAPPATDAAGSLGAFLGSAFVDRAEPATSAAAVACSSAAPAFAAPSPGLGSYLTSSFAPLAATGFAPLEELKAEALAAAPHREVDLPTSAEEVANQPSLDEVLDVPGAGEEKKGWWSDDHVAEQVAPEQKPREETVQSAGAQADGFVSRGFSETDAEGAVESAGADASKQSLSPAEKSAATPSPAAAPSPSSTSTDSSSSPAAAPLGSFLSTSFTTSSPPSASDFPASSSADSADKLVNTALTSGTVRAAGAQGDAFVGKSYTQADREGVVDEPKVKASDSHGSNALGQYLTTHFAADSSSSSSAAPIPQQPEAGVASSSDARAEDKDAPENEEVEEIPRKADDGEDEDKEEKDAPSLTLALFSAWHAAPWSRKIWAVLASIAINVGLPFVNGVMLGFGELFARNVLGVRLGWPLHSNSPTVATGVGLRSAGSRANTGRIGTEVPGNAGAKTAAEALVESVAE